jgi:hypothetical protein
MLHLAGRDVQSELEVNAHAELSLQDLFFAHTPFAINPFKQPGEFARIFAACDATAAFLS